MPKYKMSLNEQSINKLLEDLKAYRTKVKKAPEQIVHRLTEQGVSFAKQNAVYMSIYDSGELVNGIVSEYKGKTSGVVASTAEHSAFCEFGTGIVGAGSPHPDPAPGWQYDVNEHGEEGWWYYDDEGRKWWTKGMPSRPYMYDTARMMRNQIVPIAKEVLK